MFYVRFRLLPSIFVFLGLALLIALGTWQLQRYRQATDAEQRQDTRVDEPVVDVGNPGQLGDAELESRRLQVSGRWDRRRIFLINNRVNDGDPGWWVVRLLIVGSGKEARVLPVNLGWVAREEGRQRARSLLEESTPEQMEVTGLLHRPEELASDDEYRSELDAGRPEGVLELNHLDLAAISRSHPASPVSRPVVLIRGPDDTSVDADLVAGYEHVTDPYLTAERHFGYMLTWYLLAVGLLALWVAHGFGYLGSRSFEEPDET